MKKYLFLIICLVVAAVGVVEIPNIINEFAKECASVSVVNSTASESIFCKGVIEEDNGVYVARVQISEEDVSKVSVGKSAKIFCKALGDKVLDGKVNMLSDFAYKIAYGGVNITVVDAIITFNYDYKELKAGYSATAEIVYTQIDDAVILPFEGVAQEKNGKYYVYKINENWAVKEYVDIAFEDEKGAVVSGKCDFVIICEEPENFSGDFVRIKNVGYD